MIRSSQIPFSCLEIGRLEMHSSWGPYIVYLHNHITWRFIFIKYPFKMALNPSPQKVKKVREIQLSLYTEWWSMLWAQFSRGFQEQGGVPSYLHRNAVIVQECKLWCTAHTSRKFWLEKVGATGDHWITDRAGRARTPTHTRSKHTHWLHVKPDLKDWSYHMHTHTQASSPP